MSKELNQYKYARSSRRDLHEYSQGRQQVVDTDEQRAVADLQMMIFRNSIQNGTEFYCQ